MSITATDVWSDIEQVIAERYAAVDAFCRWIDHAAARALTEMRALCDDLDLPPTPDYMAADTATITVPVVQATSVNAAETGGWTPTPPDRESLLAGLDQLHGGLIRHDAADDMTRYWHADTSDDEMPGTVIVTEGGEPGTGAAHQSSPGLTGRSIRRALDSIARLGRGQV